MIRATILRRASWVYVLMVLLLVTAQMLVPADSAQAAPWDCKSAPTPAAPDAGAMGDSTQPEFMYRENPISNPEYPFGGTYGWSYKLFAYDNGCVPGSSFLPQAGTQASNIITEPIGMLAGIGHAIHSNVLNPEWLEPIDAAVNDAVESVMDSTWAYWLPVGLLIVGVIMMWATRAGRLDGTVTTFGWAAIVMIVISLIGNYPGKITETLDTVVRDGSMAIFQGFTDTGSGPPGPPGTDDVDPVEIQHAIDQQWDGIVRQTSYQTWLRGTFGTTMGPTVDAHAADLFEASHLNWYDWALISVDTGKMQPIIDEKADLFWETAEEIQNEDPYAYNYLTGWEWGNRLANALVGLLGAIFSMLFLMVAGIGMFIGFMALRIALVFAPAAGVVFLFEPTRNMALGLLGKVGKYIVMGPVFILAGLVVLRINSAIANSDMTWWLKLLLFLVVSVVAWKLIRPIGTLTGGGALKRMLKIAGGTMLGNKLSGLGRRKRKDEEQEEDTEPTPKNEPVMTPKPSAPALMPLRRPAPGQDRPRDGYGQEDPLHYYVVPKPPRPREGTSPAPSLALGMGTGAGQMSERQARYQSGTQYDRDSADAPPMRPARPVLAIANTRQQDAAVKPGEEEDQDQDRTGAPGRTAQYGQPMGPSGAMAIVSSSVEQEPQPYPAPQQSTGATGRTGVWTGSPRERALAAEARWAENDQEREDQTTREANSAAAVGLVRVARPVAVEHARNQAAPIEASGRGDQDHDGTRPAVVVTSGRDEAVGRPEPETETRESRQIPAARPAPVSTAAASEMTRAQREQQLSEAREQLRRQADWEAPPQPDMQVHEANLTIDQDGNRVYAIYRGPSAASVQHQVQPSEHNDGRDGQRPVAGG